MLLLPALSVGDLQDGRAHVATLSTFGRHSHFHFSNVNEMHAKGGRPVYEGCALCMALTFSSLCCLYYLNNDLVELVNPPEPPATEEHPAKTQKQLGIRKFFAVNAQQD